MNRSLLWRGLLILAVVVGSVLLVYPPAEKINLGLDLRGGMHLVLQVKAEDALRAETDADMERLRQQAAEEGLVDLVTRRTGDDAFDVRGVPPASEPVIAKAAADFLPGWSWERQGDRLVFEMTPENRAAIRRLAVTQALQTINNRVDQFGVAEATFAEIGNERIVVQLPGVDDPDRVRRLIKNTAFLEFRLTELPREGGAGFDSREAVVAQLGGRLPENVEILPRDERDDQGRLMGQRYYAVTKQRVITGRDLKNARPGLGQMNEPVVNFTVSASGAEMFGRATGDNIGRGLAIVLDGKVVSAPVINARITDSGVIEGGFTQKEVEDLSTVLRSGALPAGIVTLEERTVGPSLGRDSIEKGLKAGLIGTVLVVLYILIVYNLTGLNAVLALALNVLLVFAGLAFFRGTLTLPGIAGIILTIGMAVDANVLIFERIREELRAGRTVKSAIQLGFEKALSSIIDSNLTTLIAALFLFQFGTGPIRGFAVTLSIGILASMFTAIFVSRWLFDTVLSRRHGLQKLSI
ncbi:MAG TPA: protein translocase subunit SecD [Thermoanaerobaculia bacterium]|nr:protein translocase subunit SecD [Thermoanaerobaculia bacterium]